MVERTQAPKARTKVLSARDFRGMLQVELHTGLPPEWFNGRKQALVKRSHLVRPSSMPARDCNQQALSPSVMRSAGLLHGWPTINNP
jgi:hypothetical protein